MPQNKTLEGLALGLVGTGGTESLGWNFLCDLSKRKDLAENGIIGSAGLKIAEKDSALLGVTKVYIHNRNPEKTNTLIAQAKANIRAGNAILQKQLESGSFAIVPADHISDITNSTDLCFLLYDTVPGPVRRAMLKTTSNRSASFSSNLDTLLSWKGHFAGYKGFVFFCTNPTDYMTYFGREILGLEKDQCGGFGHVDTDRLRSELQNIRIDTLPILTGLSDKEKKEVSIALEKLDFKTAYMIGNHSKNSFPLFSYILSGMPPTKWNESQILSKGELKNQIKKKVHEMAGKLSETVGAPNDNCIIPLIDVLAGMVTGEGIFEIAYHIENHLRKEMKARYGVDVKDIATGVPVEFNRTGALGKIIRSILAKQYRKDKHTLNIAWGEDSETDKKKRYNEKELWDEVVTKNAADITEATILKNNEGRHRFLNEMAIPVISSLNSHTLALAGQDSGNIECEELPDGKKTYRPKVCCFAAENNRLVALSREKRKTLHVIDFPYFSIDDLVKNTSTKPNCKHIDLGPFDGNMPIYVGISDNSIYMVEDRKIEKRDMKNPTKVIACEEYDFNIGSFLTRPDAIFCGTEDGEIKKINRANLTVLETYKGTDRSALSMIKLVEYTFEKGGKTCCNKYLFGATESNGIYVWDIESKAPARKILNTKNNCFAVQAESFKGEPVLCVYSLNKDHNIEITPICYSDEFIHGLPAQKEVCGNSDFKHIIKNPLGKKDVIRGLEIVNGELFLLSDRDLVRILGKNEEDAKIVGFSKYIGPINQFGFVKTRT